MAADSSRHVIPQHMGVVVARRLRRDRWRRRWYVGCLSCPGLDGPFGSRAEAQAYAQRAFGRWWLNA